MTYREAQVAHALAPQHHDIIDQEAPALVLTFQVSVVHYHLT
jgi:hypothetical protein